MLNGSVSCFLLPIMRSDLTVCSAVPSLCLVKDGVKTVFLMTVLFSQVSDEDRKKMISK